MQSTGCRAVDNHLSSFHKQSRLPQLPVSRAMGLTAPIAAAGGSVGSLHTHAQCGQAHRVRPAWRMHLQSFQCTGRSRCAAAGRSSLQVGCHEVHRPCTWLPLAAERRHYGCARVTCSAASGRTHHGAYVHLQVRCDDFPKPNFENTSGFLDAAALSAGAHLLAATRNRAYVITSQGWTYHSCSMRSTGAAAVQPCAEDVAAGQQFSFAHRRAEKRPPARAAAAGGDCRRWPGGAVDGKVRRGCRAHTRGAGGARPPWRQGCRLEGVEIRNLANLIASLVSLLPGRWRKLENWHA